MNTDLRWGSWALVICDMDGVLVATSPCHEQAYSELWGQLGITGPEYETIAGRKTREVVAEYTAALSPSEEHILRWVARKQERARSLMEVVDLRFDDTIPFLNHVAARGVPLALGTSASKDTTQSVLECQGLTEYFGSVVTADDVMAGKPAPDIYSRIVDRTGTRSAEVLIIEDSMAGVEAALAAQAFAVSVRTGVMVEHPRFLGAFRDLTHVLVTLEGTGR
jgi:HAD superfamily hydrolase (TIGR01509 family)